MTSPHPENNKSQSASGGTRILITGGAGYVGAMLADQFSKSDKVEKVICLDKELVPDLLAGNDKITWIPANTSDGTWQTRAAMEKPTVVVHAAWQIREMYSDQETQWQWNIDGSDAVFDFAFTTPGVEKLIHFSTASGYGAEPDNSMDHLFAEDEPLRERTYLYGVEKIEAERRLEEKIEALKEAKQNIPQVVVVRPAAITGPRGRGLSERFGLQSALTGVLRGSFVYTLVRALVFFVPVTPKWCRQFIHEDDVTDIVAMFTFKRLKKNFDVFNITPNSIVRGKDMAEIIGKKKITLPPALVRIAFFFFWHLTRGKVPTSRGSWKFYSYPVVMDGSKLTREYKFNYSRQSREALEKNEGRYTQRTEKQLEENS